MKSNWINLFLIGLVLTICAPAYGRIQFTKLTAREVYKALREAGRLDAVPEGRVVTQGIAAATGFIAGVAKGIGIPMLIGLVSGMGSTNTTTGETQTQEICFSSRSAFEVNDNDDESENEGDQKSVDENNAEKVDGEDYEEDDEESAAEGRQAPPSPPPSPPPATPTTSQVTGNTPTSTVATTNPTTTQATSPSQGTTGTGTTGTDGTGSGTVSGTTTQTGGGSVNCVVIQKPAVG